MRILFAFFMLLAPCAQAAGTVSLSWDTCTGPLNRKIQPGSLVSFYVSEIGHSEPHYGYDVRVQLSTWCGTDGATPLPDAWRFEDGGCQGPDFLLIEHLTPDGSYFCYSFQGAVASQQIKQFTYDPLSGKAEIALVNAYPAGAISTDPTKRYYLARVLFDQTFGAAGPSVPGVACGGLEQPVCLLLRKASWLDGSSTERAFAVANACIGANDLTGSGTGCNLPTAARPATWGAIRSQYRN
jgi:hypothetical protein